MCTCKIGVKGSTACLYQYPHDPVAPVTQHCPLEVHSDTPGSPQLPGWSHRAGSSDPSSPSGLASPKLENSDDSRDEDHFYIHCFCLIFEMSLIRQVAATVSTSAAYLHKSKDHGCLTGSYLLLSLSQLDKQHLPPFLQQGSYTCTQQILRVKLYGLTGHVTGLTWNGTICFLLQLLGEGRLADVIHEFEQIVPTLPSEAGLHVAKEGEVLLPWVRLGEKLLEGLQQWKQDLLLVNRLVASKETTLTCIVSLGIRNLKEAKSVLQLGLGTI